jgi:plastocyanin
MHSRHNHTPWAGALALAALFAGCGGGGAASTPVDPGTGGGGTQAVVTRVAVDPPAASVAAGGTLQLTATPMDAAGAPVAGTEAATWSSSAPGVARVSATGMVTGVAAGTASITASIAAGGTQRTASAHVTVTAGGAGQPPAPTFTSLSLTPANGGVAVGSTLTLTATPLGVAGEALAGLPAATFTSSNPAAASVNGAGVVTGVAAGSVVITASLTAGGVTRSATAAITVTATAATAPSRATVRGLEHAFSPASVTIAVGGTVTWTMVDDEHDVTWLSAAPAGGNIPKMDEDESVSRTFTTAGTYNYRCVRHENHNETGTVIVQAGSTTPPPTQQPVFTSLTLTPAAPSVAVGATAQLTATPRDQNGQPMAGLPAPVFTTSAPGVVTVNGSGVVTGVAQGTATVTATLISGGVTRTASATVTVTAGGTTPPPPPPPPATTVTVTTPGSSFAPPVVTITAGSSVTWDIQGATHNVTFSGPAPAGGSIPDTRGATATRQFTTPGNYDYVCTRHAGMQGRVVVQ